MALNDTPSKRFKPKAPPAKFNWVGDPADRLRGKGDAITGDQSKSMLAFNRNLTEPLDRGGGSAIRINGAPVALAGTGTQSIGRRQRWQQTTPAQAAAIAARFKAPANPNLTTTPSVAPAGQITPPLETLADPPNPSTLEIPPVPNPNYLTEGSTIPNAGQLRDPGGPLATDAAPIPPPGTLDSQGNPITPPESTPPRTLTGFDPSHGREDTAEANGGGGPPSLRSPITGAPVARPDLTGDPKPPIDDEATRQADFLSKGGSLAQFHQSEVAKGLRPPIDARTRPDPLRSTASADIRNSMGFGRTPQETASNVANQMADEFNANHAVQQQAWRQKFDDAHANLMKSLQQDN